MKRPILVILTLVICWNSANSQELNKSVKVLERGVLEVGIYLFEAKNLEIARSFNKNEILKRINDSVFVVKVPKDSEKKKLPQGTFYTISDDWKLAPDLIQKSFKDSVILSVSVIGDYFKSNSEFDVIGEHGNFLIIMASPDDLEKLKANEFVTHIGLYKSPKKESPVSFHDLNVNKINFLKHKYPTLTGQGLNVSIKELLFDTLDIDLKNRYELTGIEASSIDQHATLIATLITGAGNSSYRGEGVAPAAINGSSSYLNLFPDNTDYYTNHEFYVQNHSYGTGLEHEYGNEAAAYDQNVNDLPKLIHVFSSGNSGLNAPETGPYEGMTGFANLTGNFKQAKNILTVGAVDKYKNVLDRSSKGPAYDGRVKPELVAYAPSGTSDAAALVSGTALLLQEKYRDFNGEFPDASLIKAILIAGAEDVGAPHVDFSSGYGNLDAEESMEIVHSGNYFEDEVSSNDIKRFLINIPENVKEIKLALSWNDPAANPGDHKALVNDLDLKLVNPLGEVWLPWVLNSQGSESELTAFAVRDKDDLNSNELITMEYPVAGEYYIEVSAGNIIGSQSFSLAYTLLKENHFEWTFPTSDDDLLVNRQNILRWENTFIGENAILEYKINDSDWQLILQEVNLQTEFFEWYPEQSGKAQLRLTVGGNEFETGSFTISPELTTEVLYNCDDDFLLAWDKVEGATGYSLQNLGEFYMEEVLTIPDTSAVIDKLKYSSEIWSVLPIFNDKNGIQGTAINYQQQGVLCHYENFFAFLGEGETVNMALNLRSLHQIQEIRFQRRNGGETKLIEEFSNPINSNQLVTVDQMLEPGLNSYFVEIILNDGTVVETEKIEIFVPDSSTFTFYPNPLRSGETLTLISKGDDLDFEIFDLTGKRVFKEQLLRYTDKLEISINSSGLYIIRAMRNGKKVGAAKLLVRQF